MAKELCVWCLAMKTFYQVNKQVAPKKAMVKDLEIKLNNDNLCMLLNSIFNKQSYKMELSVGFNLFLWE